MHLQGLGFENYRVFRDYQYLKFNPITILTGANNTGKSSVFKGILFLQDSIKSKKSNTFSLDLSGKEHFLGNIKNIVNDTDKNLKIAVPFPFLALKKTILTLEYEIDKDKKYTTHLKRIYLRNHIDNIDIIDLQYVRASQKEKDNWFEGFQKAHGEDWEEYLNGEAYLQGHIKGHIDVGYINDCFKELNLILSKYDEERNKNFKTLFRHSNNKKILTIDEFLNDNQIKSELNYLKYDYLTFLNSVSGKLDQDKIEDFLGIQNLKRETFNISIKADDVYEIYPSNSINESDLIYFRLLKELKNHLPLQVTIQKEKFNLFLFYFQRVWDLTFNSISQITHIPTLRGVISRVYNMREDNLFNRLLFAFDKNKREIPLKFINSWLTKFEIGNDLEVKAFYELEIFQVIISSQNRKRYLVDFGYGIMQFVTILIQISVLAAENHNRGKYSASTLLIEEPETNLHPKWQSKLAELFADAKNKFNIQFIIESHSEYMIRGFQNLVADETLQTNDIGILYLRNPSGNAKTQNPQISEIGISKDGSIPFNLFDSGFFDERIKLEHTLLNINFHKQYEKLNEELERIDKEKTEFETKLQELEEELNDASVNKEELETEIDKLKQLQELKEAEYNAIIAQKEQEVSDYVNKLDFSKHRGTVVNNFTHHADFQTNTIEYLASGYHLLELFNESATVTDYAPAVIQFGRAVECEIMYLFKIVKDEITSTYSSDFNDWITDYRNEIQTSNISALQKYEFRDYIKKTGDKFYKVSFGETNKVLNLMSGEPNGNIDAVRLLKELRLYLENQFFNHWNNIKSVLNLLTNIVDDRNNAAHTYHATGLSQSDAIQYKGKVEAFLRTWTEEMS